MSISSAPVHKPINPCFSSGPTAKRPGWTPNVLRGALLGQSHRSAAGLERIRKMLVDMRAVLQIPNSHLMAMVAGSATGAVEMALWNFLGARGVDCLAWDIFGHRWQNQLKHALPLTDLRCLNAPEGQLPPLDHVDFDRDVVFLWNGSTSGVRVPDGNWISDQRQGLTICDATSAAFAMDLPWPELDVTAFSWQKGLGGEAAHGMLVLSPAAVDRLQNYCAPWPIPGLYRLQQQGKFSAGLFDGLTTSTPSMLCVEDCLDALQWAKSIGGLSKLIERSEANKSVIQTWIQDHHKFEWLCDNMDFRSSTTMCFKFNSNFRFDSTVDEWNTILDISQQLTRLNVAYDCHNHTAATPAFRFWGGPTVESTDIAYALKWLDHIMQ